MRRFPLQEFTSLIIKDFRPFRPNNHKNMFIRPDFWLNAEFKQDKLCHGSQKSDYWAPFLDYSLIIHDSCDYSVIIVIIQRLLMIIHDYSIQIMIIHRKSGDPLKWWSIIKFKWLSRCKSEGPLRGHINVPFSRTIIQTMDMQ